MNKFSRKSFTMAIALLAVPAAIYAVDVTYDNLTTLATGRFGSSNTFSGSPAASIGWNNVNNKGGSLTVGEGLYSQDKNCTVLGAYNPKGGVQDSRLFLVGNGISKTENNKTTLWSSNAFEVMTAGNVNIPLNLPPEGTNPKLTVGNSGLSGSATVTAKIYGTAEIDRVPAKGGISMGIFTAQ